MDALTGLTEDDSAIFDYANALVGQALEMWTADRDFLGVIRKAASRLDELTFGPTVADI
ncbi:MAG TPA: hypothetical protein VFC47_05230 [Caulobacteraceae bacterium]|nr:hypothetical protein [Caulobacteraceae bacterium]